MADSQPGIIFDLDGTLADTLTDLTDAVNVGLDHLDRPACTAAQVRAWIGEGLPLLCRRALGECTDAMVTEMADVVTQHYRAHRLDKTAPYPGIPELLDELTRRGLPLAILSNKPHQHTQPMTDALFSQWSFVAVEGYREESLRKPDPRTTLSIVERMNRRPGEVYFVGDSATDIRTARNAGVIAVAVSWGYRDRPVLVDAGPDHIIDKPAEFLALL